VAFSPFVWCRSHYYEKVGFRGVEEKKSLDILLAEKPIEREKLQSFCLRSSQVLKSPALSVFLRNLNGKVTIYSKV
jgi:hypothetical protein